MSRILVEAAVESLSAALAAAEGGAHRIELCVDLAHGGTTPPVDLIRHVVAELTIQVFVLVRPRTGDFAYTHEHHRAMLEQIRQAQDAGAAGIVTGALDRLDELVAAAQPLPVTFHRAFDEKGDLEEAIRLGFDRVLTSGGARTAPEGAEQIARYVRQARGRITILPGGGIDASNVAQLVRETGVQEVHFSVKDANKVRAVLAQV
jgi:copper homeostasis protein